MDSPLPYSEREFNETPTTQLDKFRVELTIRKGFRKLPSNSELLEWAHSEYGDGLSEDEGYIGKALSLGVYLDFYPSIAVMDYTMKQSNIASHILLDHYADEHIPQGFLTAYVGPYTESHGINLLRGMWLVKNEPLIVKAIMRYDNNPSSVHDWWNWAPPTY